MIRLEETYNIHKNINSILPFFKSKILCKKGIHNYGFARFGYDYDLVCFCCGKKEKLEELLEE